MTWLLHMCGVTPSQVWHDLYMCGTTHSTHSWLWHAWHVTNRIRVPSSVYQVVCTKPHTTFSTSCRLVSSFDRVMWASWLVHVWHHTHTCVCMTSCGNSRSQKSSCHVGTWHELHDLYMCWHDLYMCWQMTRVVPTATRVMCQHMYSQLQIARHSILRFFLKTFNLVPRRTRILMGFVIYYLVLIVNPMGLVRWKSFRKNLEMLCHPICNWLYKSWALHDACEARDDTHVRTWHTCRHMTHMYAHDTTRVMCQWYMYDACHATHAQVMKW